MPSTISLTPHSSVSIQLAPISTQLPQQLFICNPQQLSHPHHRRPHQNESCREHPITHSHPEEQQRSPARRSQYQPTTSSLISGATRQQREKHCIVEGCPELIAPSMWKVHMTLHVQGVFSRDVPNTWLEEHDLSICHLCH